MHKQLLLPLNSPNSPDKTDNKKLPNANFVICLKKFSKRKEAIQQKKAEAKIFDDAIETAEKIFG